MTDADMAVSTEWLARNAQHVGTDNWPETQDTDRRSRAVKQHDDTLIAPEEGMGRWQVSYPDGEPHQVLLVKSQNEYAGSCDCKAFRKGGHTCSHLLAIRIGEFSDRTDVPESHDYVTELSRDDAVPADSPEDGTVDGVDVCVHCGEDIKDGWCPECDGGGAESSGQDAPSSEPAQASYCTACEEPTTFVCDNRGRWLCSSCGSESLEAADTPEETTQSTDVEPVQEDTTTPSPPAQSDDAFATEMPDVPKKYQIDMGGETFIRKAGYARLLKQMDWRPIIERDVRAKDTEYERAEVTAKIVDNKTGNELGEAIGTAGPPADEDMTNAHMHLDELAETRAWTRAASIATGEGLTAFAELPENASEVVGE